MQIRQGEFLLVSVDAHLGRVSREETSQVVLGTGETGNAHTLVAEKGEKVVWLRSALADINAHRVAVGPAGAVLMHVEHADLFVPEGVYDVVRKREQMPGDNLRFVED